MASPVAAAPSFPPLDGVIGAFLVGTILSIFLAGITTVQAFGYFTHFARKDRPLLVGLVSVLMVIDLFHTAISCYTIYLWTVTHYGDLAFLVRSPWSFAWDPFLTGIVALIVQVFYAWRVYIVSRRQWWIPAGIVLLSLLQCSFAIASTVKIYQFNSLFSRFGEFSYGVAIWTLSAAASDILITSSLIYYLRQATQNDYQHSLPIVQRIIRTTVETNGLTCIFAIVDAVLFVAMPADSWHVIPNLSLVKLYFNGCLVSLNSRRSVGGRDITVSGGLGGTSYSPGIGSSPAPKYTATLDNGEQIRLDELAKNVGQHGSQAMRRSNWEGIQITTVREVETRVDDHDSVLEGDLEKGTATSPHPFALSYTTHPEPADTNPPCQASPHHGTSTGLSNAAIPSEWSAH